MTGEREGEGERRCRPTESNRLLDRVESARSIDLRSGAHLTGIEAAGADRKRGHARARSRIIRRAQVATHATGASWVAPPDPDTDTRIGAARSRFRLRLVIEISRSSTINADDRIASRRTDQLLLVSFFINLVLWTLEGSL